MNAPQIDALFRQILADSESPAVKRLQVTRVEDGLLIARLQTHIARLEEENFSLKAKLRLLDARVA